MDQTLPAPLPRFQATQIMTFSRFVALDDSTVRIDGDLASALRLYYRRSGQVRLAGELTDGRLDVQLLIGERGDIVADTFTCDAGESTPVLATTALDMGEDAPEAFASAFERFADLCAVELS